MEPPEVESVQASLVSQIDLGVGGGSKTGRGVDLFAVAEFIRRKFKVGRPVGQR